MRRRLVALALAGLLSTAPVVAIEDRGGTIELSEQEVATCRAGGGCLLITRDALLRILRGAAAACGPTT